MYTLFFNGIIHTLDDNNLSCNAILVQNDRIAYCGKGNEINVPDSTVKKYDLNGLHIYPGFIDCHTHVASVALAKERLRLDKCLSLSSALTMIKKHVTKYKAGTWILGSGWNSNLWSDGQPEKSHLDKLTSVHPVALYNKDGHTQWLNSKALEICRFDLNTPDPSGGKLGRDSKGNLTGLVYEKACDVVYHQSEKITYDKLYNCLEKTYPELHTLGITSVHSCESMTILSLFQEMSNRDDLKLRICFHPPEADAQHFIEHRLVSGSGNEWLRLGGLKYFVDGSLGSQTAEMFENYNGLTHAGIEVITEDDLTEKVSYAADKGLSATIHAIGDKANSKALNALERVNAISKKSKLRHRIEHAQIIRHKDIARFADLSVIASMQPVHISDDVKIADKYLGERSISAYRIRSLIKSGCKVVFGSDMPMADPDPLKGIRAAISRRYLLRENEPIWNENERIPASWALRAYTCDAAFASYEDHIKGTLAEGKLADFIGLRYDIEQADEALLRDMKVEITVLGGKIVYKS